MGQMYAITFDNVAVTASQDFFEIQPADDRPVKIHALYLSQSTELGDAQEEQLRILIRRGHTTSGSVGSAATPRPLDPNAPAAAMTAEVNNTTIASLGTTVDLHVDTWNVRTNYVYMPTPESRPIANQANTTIVVRLQAAPVDSVSVSGTLIVEEL